MASIYLGYFRGYSNSSAYGNYNCYFQYDSTSRSGSTAYVNGARIYMERDGTKYTTNRLALKVGINGSSNNIKNNATLSSSGTHSYASYNVSLGNLSYSTESTSFNVYVAIASTGRNTGWTNFQSTPLEKSFSVTVPAATTSISNVYLSSRTSSSITSYWSSVDKCSKIRYGTSTSNYSEVTVNASSGTFTISGLSQNSNYTIYVQPLKENGVWGNWKSYSASTFHSDVYPTSMAVSNITPFTCTLSTSSSATGYTNGVEFSIYTTGGTLVKSTQYLDSNLQWSWAVSGLAEETSYVAKFRTRTTGSNNWSGYYTVNFTTLSDQARAWIKLNGTWVQGRVFAKINGNWTVAKKVYAKSNNNWVQGINN